MSTLTKLALGLMGQLKARPPAASPDRSLPLPLARTRGGLPLMEALGLRRSQRDFRPEALPPQVLSDLLWAVAGVNREESGGRTAPSAMDSQEIVLHAALPTGLYRYEPATHTLLMQAPADARRLTGYQDFVDQAPLGLVYVADLSRMKLVAAALRDAHAHAAAGAMAQNAYLYCASAGLATVVRAWLDREALARAMGLEEHQRVLLSQTVGHPATA